MSNWQDPDRTLHESLHTLVYSEYPILKSNVIKSGVSTNELLGTEIALYHHLGNKSYKSYTLEEFTLLTDVEESINKALICFALSKF